MFTQRYCVLLFVVVTAGCSQRSQESAALRTEAPQSPVEPAPDVVSTPAVPSIEGKWEIVSLLKNGVESAPPGGPIAIEYRNGRQIMSQKGAVIDDVAYEFDASVIPHLLDTIHRDNLRNEGLATIEGDVLKICVGGGHPRPTEMKSTADYNLTTLKRL